MFSFNFKFDRQLNVSNQIHQKESWKSVDVVLGSIKRLKLTAQGMEQRTNVQSQVWYHSAVHIVNFNMSKELKIQISQTCLQMDGGCQCSVGDNISKSCLWVFVFKLKSLKCVFYLSLSLSLSLFQFESNKIFQQKNRLHVKNIFSVESKTSLKTSLKRQVFFDESASLFRSDVN